jgi:outer membrane protein assembly factor BamD
MPNTEQRMPMMRFMESWRTAVACALLAVALAGCSWLPTPGKDETATWSADQIYREAHDALLQGNYTRAVKLFETLEARYPYGRYAQQAILEGAFANWRANEATAAIAGADRFIRTYPNHPNVDYAYYLKGLVHFREDQGIFGYVYELDLSERDPKEMRASFAAFKELVTRFPESQYAEDSVIRMKYLNNALGMYEVKVALYYYNRGAFIAASNRAQLSILNNPQTPSNAEALAVLAQSYDKLGLTTLADDSRRVLVKTFPDSKYVKGIPARPWWQIWSPQDTTLGIQPTGELATKPWWKFWD